VVGVTMGADLNDDMDSPPQESAAMHATTVAIDLAKDIFELAFADAQHRVIERKRFSRSAFSRCLLNPPPLRVVMEACGSAHHWARVFQAQGHAVRLLPVRDVRPCPARPGNSASIRSHWSSLSP
jgi:transposase